MHCDPITLAPGLLSLQRLDLELKPEWASSEKEYRAKIRRRLREKWGHESLLNLDSVPRLKERSLSVSHCKAMGGFAEAEPGVHFGFDVEVKSRVNPERIHLVCRDSEKGSPSAAATWVAKEAAYKALYGHLQPAGLADLEIFRWEKLHGETYAFAARFAERPLPLTGRGICLDISVGDEQVTLGFCVWPEAEG